MVADISAPPALQPDGTLDLDPAQVAELAELAAGMAAEPDVLCHPGRATGDTRSPRRYSLSPPGRHWSTALAKAANGRSVLALPYVEVSPDALAPVDLLGELGHQLERGTAVLEDALGVTASGSTTLAPPDLGADGLAALRFIGVQRVVVPEADVEPLDTGIITYSLAQPFLLAPPAGRRRDPRSRPSPSTQSSPSGSDPPGSPGLIVSRVLAELAFPGWSSRAWPAAWWCPSPPGTPAAVVEGLLSRVWGAAARSHR